MLIMIVHPFTASPGITINMVGKTPLDFFHLFINDVIKYIIFTESTKFATQEDEAHLLLHPHARGHDWKKIHYLYRR